MRRLLALAVPLLVLLAVPAGAHAELRFCKGLQARVGDSPVTWKVSKVAAHGGLRLQGRPARRPPLDPRRRLR